LGASAIAARGNSRSVQHSSGVVRVVGGGIQNGFHRFIHPLALQPLKRQETHRLNAAERLCLLQEISGNFTTEML
jgi:hypothetical protein